MDGGGEARREVLGSFARATLVVVLLVFGYYAAPLDRVPDAAAAVLLAGGLLLMAAAVVVVGIRAIPAANRPRLRAVRILQVGAPSLLVVFSSAYRVLDAAQPGAFTEPLSPTDALYLSLTLFATVGLGDIAPVSDPARVLVMIQMVAGLLTVGVVARMAFGAAERAEATRTAAEP